MNIWITRSEPGATVLAYALEAAGFAVFKAPVLEIRPLPCNAPADRFHLAIFLSAHGVRLAAPRVKGCFDRAFAVGLRTAAALAEAGVNARAADTESSEGLLDSLPDLAGKRVLLVSGVGGRNLIAPALAERGAEVRRLEVYERLPTTPAIDSKGIDALVVSSGDGFRQAVRVWFAAKGSREVPILVPSQRVADLGPELGVSKVLACDGAGPDAVLAVLRRMERADG